MTPWLQDCTYLAKSNDTKKILNAFYVGREKAQVKIFLSGISLKFDILCSFSVPIMLTLCS